MPEYTRDDLEVMDEEELDELVIDLKLAEASDINNGGKDAQIAYMLSEYGRKEE